MAVLHLRYFEFSSMYFLYNIKNISHLVLRVVDIVDFNADSKTVINHYIKSS